MKIIFIMNKIYCVVSQYRYITDRRSNYYARHKKNMNNYNVTSIFNYVFHVRK